MGFSGRVVVARSVRPLSEVPAVRQLGVEALEEVTYRDGWRSVKLDGSGAGPDRALRALVAETGAPVLSAFILDSDLAEVEAMTPGGLRWRAYLHESTALDYGAPALEHPVDEVVRRALAWCAEAGLTSSEAALGEVFAVHNVFAEDTLDELITALGVAPEGAPAAGGVTPSGTA